MAIQFRSHNSAWHIASSDLLVTGSVVNVTRRTGSVSQVVVLALMHTDETADLPYIYSFEDLERARRREQRLAVQNTLRIDIPIAGRLFDLFENAQRHSLRPAVRFNLQNTDRGLRLEMADQLSRYAGSLLALSNRPGLRGRRAMYGALNPAGEFTGITSGTEIERLIFNEVAAQIRAFAMDPAGVATSHGLAHGNCCFCGQGLTDPRSMAVGYGPICADHYGLPWGESEAPTVFNSVPPNMRQPAVTIDASEAVRSSIARDPMRPLTNDEARALLDSVPPNLREAVAMDMSLSPPNATVTIVDGGNVHRRPARLQTPPPRRARPVPRTTVIGEGVESDVSLASEREPRSATHEELNEDDFVWQPRQQT